MCILRTFFERKRPPIVALRGAQPAVLQVLRQIPHVHEITGRRDARARNHIFQLAHVSRPGMPQQHRLRAPRQPGDIFSVRRSPYCSNLAQLDGGEK